MLYFRGIRFYEMESAPKTAEFRRAEFKTVQGHSVAFSFIKRVAEILYIVRIKSVKSFLLDISYRLSLML